MKDIVIIANFCRDFSENDNGRFMYLCKELSKEHNVEIITSDFIHGEGIHKEPLTIKWPFKITFLHEPGYKKNVSVQRFLSHCAWGKEVKKYLKTRKCPDVIYCAIPSLTAPLAAAKYCEKNNVKFIVDVQDLWPEAFKMVLDIPVVSSLLFAPFDWRVNAVYKRADAAIAVSQTYVDRVLRVNKKCADGHAVFLGTKIETFDEGASAEPKVRKPEGELWIGYCGSLSVSYDIPTVIRAMKSLREKGHEALKLIVMGDGPHRGQFEELAKENDVDSIFFGKLAYGDMCAQVKQCDIVVNPIKGKSAASIINKHGDYAASGLPVVNTQDSPEYRKLVDSYQMGFNCHNGDADDMAEKLERLIQDKSLRLQMGANARRCAEEKFDRKHSYQEILKAIVE
jgi:glycosyltransferase involved in cell wall biosynthesis